MATGDGHGEDPGAGASSGWGRPLVLLLAIVLVAESSAYTHWLQMREDVADQRLVEQALQRASIITTIRLDAVALESAIEAHIRATSDEQRDEAGRIMDRLVARLQASRANYLATLPPQPSERLVAWNRFQALGEALADHVREAARYSSTQDEERARALLADSIQPALVELDGLASRLAAQNAEDSAAVNAALERGRWEDAKVAAGVLVVSVLLALVVGLGMERRLRRQDRIIQAQLRQLADRNAELDAFAGRVAHDVLSPLAPLNGHLTLARRSATVRADPAVVDHLERAQQGVQRISTLVESLLRFCRAGQRGEPCATAMDGVVTAQLMESSQAAAARGVELMRDIARGVTVDCPAQLLQSVAQNLLSNAIKYTEGTAGGRVEVRVFQEGAWGVLAVKDNGPGMSADVLAQVFKPFYRAPDVKDRPGHGLGLPTVKRLLEAHGGVLLLESRAGQGTTATARLPIRREVERSSTAPTLRAAREET